MPKFHIKHITRYVYQGSVMDSANQIMLYPIEDAFQEIHRHDLKISSHPKVSISKDMYQNDIGVFTISAPHSQLEIFSDLEVSTTEKALPNPNLFSAQDWEILRGLRSQIDFIDFYKAETFEGIEDLRKIVQNSIEKDHSSYTVALTFCKYVYENFSYIPGITTVESTLDEIWKLRAGVCQDFAHILLVMLRMAEIPARYVSGYICPHKNGMRGEGATHAWVEAYLPNYGWLGFDPTNNCIANETHVRLAVGRNFTDCSPVKGIYKGAAEHSLEVVVSVAYDDGTTSENNPNNNPAEYIPIPKPVTNTPKKNSFREYNELLQMQIQQQQ